MNDRGQRFNCHVIQIVNCPRLSQQRKIVGAEIKFEMFGAENFLLSGPANVLGRIQFSHVKDILRNEI